MYRRAPLPLAASLLLAACSGGGGGGGGGGGVSVPLNGPSTPFTAFSDIDPETLVAFASQSTINYQAARDDITGVADNGTLSQEETGFDLWVDDATDPAQARLSVGLPIDPDLETDFTTAAVAAGSTDDYIQFSTAGAVAPFADRLTLYLPDDPADELEYMTFGAWALGMESGTANLGAATFGRATTGLEMAGVGLLNATYNGALLGTLVEPGGNVAYYEADSEIGVDFFNSQVTILSTNTRDLDTGAFRPSLDIFNDTDATIAGNAFTGGTFSVGFDGIATGQFSGGFFGPNAEEAGASFDIERPVLGRYFGSLGGKR